MKLRLFPALSLSLALAAPAFAAPKKAIAVRPDKASSAPGGSGQSGGVAGWLQWRGPNQNGSSPETGLPEKVDAKSALWTADFPGQSSPVIANGKLYINGYLGDGPELQEAIACFDAETGKKLWEHRFNDFLSDTIYLRYATSAPAIDAETGNVYMMGTQGLFACFTADGKKLWEHSMMEEFGRLTFPNSRTASPVIDQELVITRGITSNWGAHGPAGDRFYAFDKKTGELVWTSAPGERPQDNTFSNPLLTWLDGKRVLISAGGDSTIVGINARTGDPLFRFPAAKAGAKGGINAAVVRYQDNLLVIHESENLDSSEVGRSASFKIPQGATPPEPGKPQIFDPKKLENWRNPLGNLASSPCLAGNRMYEVSGIGEIAGIDADSGKVLWKKKVAPEQRQSSPFYADGKLYVALYIAGAQAGGEVGATPTEGAGGGGNGELLVLKPGDADAEIMSRTILEGRCYGSPIGYNGKLYVQTDRKVYCFGKKGDNAKGKEAVAGAYATIAGEQWPQPGPVARLQIIPNEVFLRPSESYPLRVRALDANGFTVQESADLAQIKVEPFIPPTALVKTTMKGSYADGKLTADPAPMPSAGAFQATLAGGEKPITGTMRARVLPDLPIKQDFEAFEINQMTGPGLGGTPAAGDAPSPSAAAAGLAPGAAVAAPGNTAATAAQSPDKRAQQSPELAAAGTGLSPSPAIPAVPTAAAPAAPQPGPTNWNVIEPPTAFAYPPLPWNGARFRFEIRNAPAGGGAPAQVVAGKDAATSDASAAGSAKAAGNKALCKSIDNKLFQRGQVFIGHPSAKNYTVEADVLTEGNKRKMSEIGLINQRYLIILKGNAQQIEVNSNQERLRQSVPFKWSPNEWYHIKTRVDVAADGSGIVRAKVYKKGEAEPEAWNIEVPHKNAHPNGCPGFYCLAPQEQRAWIDNISVTPNSDPKTASN